MRKLSFVIEAGKVDSNGDIVMLNGIYIPNEKIPVLRDFDTSHKSVLSYATVFKEDGVLMASAEFEDNVISGYPAIGFQIIKSEENQHGGRTVTEAKLLCVGICMQPNADPGIPRIF